MKRRLYMRLIISGWLLVLVLLFAGIFVTPADASHLEMRNKQDVVGLNAKIYLTQETLKPLFQDRINQQLPTASSAAINNMLKNLPGPTQGWAGQIARTLIQPSATLTQLTPQQDGLNATIRLSLYPGDPQPTNTRMLVKFSVLDASTIQISGQPINGSPALISGPITTLKVPIGQLSSINATPDCGSANLMIGLQVPVDLGQGAMPAQNGLASNTNSMRALQAAQSTDGLNEIQLNTLHRTIRDSAVSSYIEIPADSLSSLSSGIGQIQISKSLSAQNIQLNVQGDQIVATADIMGTVLGAPVKLAKATTSIVPQAQNGKLTMNVQKTEMTVAIFTFPQNTYNQQIGDLLNTKIGNALAGKFNVTAVSLGGNSPISCAASDSLILSGTANLQ